MEHQQQEPVEVEEVQIIIQEVLVLVVEVMVEEPVYLLLMVDQELLTQAVVGAEVDVILQELVEQVVQV